MYLAGASAVSPEGGMGERVTRTQWTLVSSAACFSEARERVHVYAVDTPPEMHLIRVPVVTPSAGALRPLR
jgi:hypothetical protein